MASPHSLKSSSSDDGFFQEVPIIRNQFSEDVSFQRIMRFFLPSSVIEQLTPDLEKFGEEVVSKKIFDWVTDAERNVPYLKGGGRDAFGRRTSELVTTEGWKRLQEYGIQQGIVAAGYENSYAEFTRVVQFLKLHLWTGSNANVACPSAMTDGAAKLLGTHLSSNDLDAATGRVFQDAYDRLTSRDPHFAWTSGQWMTERSGGSDVSRTETIAAFIPSSIQSPPSSTPLGPWSIDGFKWFSSATDSSMSILLAQTPKGLSTFFAPMYRSTSKPGLISSDPEKELNGISISRLKNKFGTKSLPTAELQLKGTRAYLIGKEGQGIQEISTILNISRLYSAVSATGYLGRGLAIARSFARVREVGAGKGRRVMLRDAPLHMSTLSKITGEYHAMMLFNSFVAYLMGISEHRVTGLPTSCLTPPNPKDVSLLLRILTPVLKGAVCKRSIHALQECMEALGGVGYLDNTENEAINISRIYRDCCVLSIWEGTTDVLVTDMLRVLKGRGGSDVLNALEHWISRSLEVRGAHPTPFQSDSMTIQRYFTSLRQRIGATETDELLPHARQLLFEVADIVMSVLLVADAESDGDAAAVVLCSRFLLDHNIMGNIVSTGKSISSLEMNQKIVYGKSIQETCSQTVHRESSKL